MPISLRLPADIESQIAGFGARRGMSKSAVIVHSIREFLARHAQPTSFQIYEDAIRDSAKANARDRYGDAQHDAAERRPRKVAIRDAIRRKHAARSKRAGEALTKPSTRATPRRSTRKRA